MSEEAMTIKALFSKKDKKGNDPEVRPDTIDDIESEGSDGTPGDEQPGGSGDGDGGDGHDGNDDGGDDDHHPNHDPAPLAPATLSGNADDKINQLIDFINKQTMVQNDYNQKVEKYEGEMIKYREKVERMEEVRKRKENFGEESIIPIPTFFDGVFDPKHDRNKLKDYWQAIPLFDPKKNETYRITTFLKSCNRAQKECKMSEAQFKDQLRWRVTGSLTDQLDHWISNGHSINRIYCDLFTNFNLDVDPEQASNIIAQYKVSKSLTFTQTCDELDKIGLTASQKIADLDQRSVVYNNHVRNALITRMPDTISGLISDVIVDFKVHNGRDAKADEIIKALNRFSTKINLNFHASKTYNYANRKANVILEKSYHKPMTGKVDSTSTVNETKAEKGPKFFNKDKSIKKKEIRSVNIEQPSFDKTVSNPKHIPRLTSSGNHSINALNTIVGRAHPHLDTASIFKIEQSRVNNGHKAYAGKKYCVFCASFSHSGAEGCESLYTDSLAAAKATPTQQSCQTCKDKLNRDLHHPQRLCPLRQTMLDAYNKGTIAPKGVFKYFLIGQKHNNRA